MAHSMAALALGLAVAACADGHGWNGTIRDSAGITIVENPERGLWADGASPTVERELTLGAAQGADELEFAQIADIAVSEAGDIYVLDAQARTIRVFDATGAFLRTIGRAGTGPGELSPAAAAVLLGPGDSLLVPDLAERRLVRFSPRGEWIGSATVPVDEGVLVHWAVAPGGRIIQQSRMLPDVDSAVPRDFLVERDPAGAVIDTLLELPAGTALTRRGEQVRVRIFAAEPRWAIGSDGRIHFAVTSDYAIFVHAPDGTLERMVRRPFEPRPVSESDRQALLEAIAALYRRQGAPAATVPRMLASVDFAEHYPLFTDILGGPEGSIWVRRGRSADEILADDGEIDIEDTGSNRIDVFDRDGRYLGLLELPPRFTPVRVLGDRVYGVWRDELDVQHVQRLRVRGTWTAG